MNPVFIAVITFWLSTSSWGLAAKMYWTDRGAGQVNRANLDGSELQTLVKMPPGSNLRGISLDVASGKFYFADNGSDTINRANLDGTSKETLIETGSGFPADVKLDLVNGKIYWCDQTNNRIERANLDGTGREVVVQTSQPYYLDVDPEHQFLYWGYFGADQNRATDNIFRASLTGGDRVTLVSGLIQVRAVKRDPKKSRLYWADREAHVVQYSSLDGTGKQTIVEGLDTPHGMVLDPLARRVYWVDTGTNRVPGSRGGKAVNRSGMEGGEAHDILAPQIEPWDIDLDLRTTTFQEWQQRYFLSDKEAAKQKPNADPDGDRLENLMEYALSGDPNRPAEQANLFEVTIVTNEKGHRVAATKFTRFQDTNDLNYQLEISHDLQTWMHNNDGTGTLVTSEPRIRPLADEREEVIIPTTQALSTAEKTYLRLRVILTE